MLRYLCQTLICYVNISHSLTPGESISATLTLSNQAFHFPKAVYNTIMRIGRGNRPPAHLSLGEFGFEPDSGVRVPKGVVAALGGEVPLWYTGLLERQAREDIAVTPLDPQTIALYEASGNPLLDTPLAVRPSGAHPNARLLG